MSASRFRLLSIVLTLVVGTAHIWPATTASQAVKITPEQVEAGSPVLIRVNAADALSIEGRWFGRRVAFSRTAKARGWFALAGVDVEAAAGSSILSVTIHTANGDRELSRTVAIHPARYRTGSLSVAPKFVEPDPESLKQIATEAQLKSKIFAVSAAAPLWRGDFRSPLEARPTDSFGTRRMFNGKLASIHKGADFHASTGTPVRASNSGVVVLARPLYYEGNCVIIDHGLGLFTLSMHFSRIDVHEGQHVIAGERLGLSGATGRVTGPHLHWAVRWQNAYLDPVKLLRLDLSSVE